MERVGVVGLALVALTLGVRAEPDKYAIYAVRYATLANFPVSSLIAGADRTRRLDIAMMIWVLKGAAGRIAIVDSGFDADDVLELVKRNTQGKVSMVRGDDETTLSGIAFGIGGKHTWQSQFVSVQTARGTVVLASDNMYLYENLDTHKPISQTLDPVSNLRTQDRMRSLASDPRLLIPGHDPAVFDRFPKVIDRIVRIE